MRQHIPRLAHELIRHRIPCPINSPAPLNHRDGRIVLLLPRMEPPIAKPQDILYSRDAELFAFDVSTSVNTVRHLRCVRHSCRADERPGTNTARPADARSLSRDLIVSSRRGLLAGQHTVPICGRALGALKKT